MPAESSRLTTSRLLIELMAPEHAAQLADFFRRNEAHLRPWDPPRPKGITDVAYWQSEAARAAEEFREGGVARWVLFAREDGDRIIGRANYTQIVRGPFQSCMLGYAIERGCEGRGLMREALEVTLNHAFRVLRLHRVQANHLPENLRSALLLARLGFRIEGLAKEYLFINGAWRDHVLTALTFPAFDSTVLSARA